MMGEAFKIDGALTLNEQESSTSHTFYGSMIDRHWLTTAFEERNRITVEFTRALDWAMEEIVNQETLRQQQVLRYEAELVKLVEANAKMAAALGAR
jgi:hypothetical protein